MELKEIVYKLTGPIEPVGETNEDERRFSNLCKFTSLWEDMAFHLKDVSDYKDRVEYSIRRNGEKADKIIKLTAKEILYEENTELENKIDSLTQQLKSKEAEIERLKQSFFKSLCDVFSKLCIDSERNFDIKKHSLHTLANDILKNNGLGDVIIW